ncbi:hypothetical protein ACFX15_039128 [Malus domestica]
MTHLPSPHPQAMVAGIWVVVLQGVRECVGVGVEEEEEWERWVRGWGRTDGKEEMGKGVGVGVGCGVEGKGI